MAKQMGKQKYTPEFHECIVPGQVQRQQSTGLFFGQDLEADESPEDTPMSPEGDMVAGPRIHLLNDHVITSLGHPTTLECQVPEWSSVDDGCLEWVHGGKVCKGERYLSLSDAGLRYLFIRETLAEDDGEYTVVASNDAAKSEKVVNVRVAQPQPPTNDAKYIARPVQDFPKYVNKIRGSDDIKREFLGVELEWDVTQHTANLDCNMHKNRYCNVFPYDHARVVLSLQDNTPGSDYINASHIKDSVSGSRYIATQGPLPHIYGDFWRMVWEYDVHIIAMVTKSSHHFGYKEEDYWPKAINGTVTFDGMKVTLTHTEETRHWIKRSLTIENIHECDVGDPGERTEPRNVVQFQFVSWPEYGVPKRATDLLTFRRCVIDHHVQTSGPLLVHCSAGVGRTGTFISIDVLLKRMELSGTVDIFNLIRELRFRRERTVETPEQYMFVHEAIAEVITNRNKK